MVSSALRERLKDPAYLDLHMAAIGAISQVAPLPWYDAQFLQIFESAKRYLATVRPDTVDGFVEAFAPLRTPRDFRIKQLPQLFDAATVATIRHEVSSLREEDFNRDEVAGFGRTIMRDTAFFTRLQRELVPLVSDLVGTAVEGGYNFLSRYGNTGRCDPHMDSPVCMYTLDYCVDQDVEWPIHFSNVVDWPTAEMLNSFDPATVLADPSLTFEQHVLKPNDAILFAGSSQWHYREAMPAPGFCTLLFLHYYPAVLRPLLHLTDWPAALGIPELEPFCEIYMESYPYMRISNFG